MLPLLLTFHQRAGAQLGVKQSVFGNGGGTTADNQYRIAFTAGQPAIGVMSGPSNIQKSGFWYVQSITTATDVERPADNLPTEFGISQNYPNPFNPSTVVRYQLPAASYVEIVVHNVLGQKVRTLLAGDIPAGYHHADWNGHDDAGKPVASGVYLYRINAHNAAGQSFTAVKKMALVR